MRAPDLEVEVMQRLREVEVEVNLYNASKDVILSHNWLGFRGQERRRQRRSFACAVKKHVTYHE